MSTPTTAYDNVVLSYIIVKDTDSEQLEKRVSYWRARGWRVHGSLVVYSVMLVEGATTWQELEFAQAMERDV